MKRLLILVALFALVACDKQEKADSGSLATTNEKLTDLEMRLSAAETELRRHKNRLTILSNGLENTVPMSTEAQVTVDDKGYGIARTKHGSFLVIIEKAQPYLDGHKVTFRIGNMAFATFSKPKLKIQYGPRMKEEGDMDKNYETYLSSRRTKEEDILLDLAPGTYTRVPITLAPSTAEDLRDVSVSIELDVVKLH